MKNQLEQILSKQVVQYLQLSGIMFFHPANESKRTFWEQKQFKDNGGIAGVPDLCLMFPNGRMVFLELKTPTGRQSPAQKEFETKAIKLGYDYFIARTIDDVIGLIQDEKDKQ